MSGLPRLLMMANPGLAVASEAAPIPMMEALTRLGWLVPSRLAAISDLSRAEHEELLHEILDPLDVDIDVYSFRNMIGASILPAEQYRAQIAALRIEDIGSLAADTAVVTTNVDAEDRARPR